MAKKRVVYESKLRLFLLIAISCGFTFVGIVGHNMWCSIFFGLCGGVFIFKIFDPRRKIIYYGTKEYEEHINGEFDKKWNDPGIFTYTEKGFTAKWKEISQDIEWTKIRALFGYKLDLYTVDEICMDVFCDDDIAFRLTEEIPGWYKFLEKVAEQFPTVDKNWSIEIMSPAFATSLTLVYERENRTLEEVKGIYYKENNTIEHG